MAPNNGLANSKPKEAAAGRNDDDSSSSSSSNSTQQKEEKGRTTILKAGIVEDRGMGTNINSRQVISDQIQKFLDGEGRTSFRAEFRAFFTVWTFVTRLPGPTWVDHHPGYLMRGMAYFPLAGTLIGIFVSTFFDFTLFTLSLPIKIATVLSEAASLWVTGCFHEDGLADSADGIGGGWSRDEILKIMTDTRLGTYGCAILLLYMIGKVEMLVCAGTSVWGLGVCAGAGPAIIVTHTLARLTAPLLIKTKPYVDEQGPKYRFYSFFVEAKHLVTWGRVLFAIMTSLSVASLAYGIEKGMILVISVFVASFFSGRYAEYLLGGVMGDYLGATICVTEVFLLIVLEMLSNLQRHKEFVGEMLMLLSNGISSGGIGGVMDSIYDEHVWNDDRKRALFQFVVVGIFTIVWCSCVGHPPVFVRKSVARTDETDDIRIALDEDDEKAKSGGSNETNDTCR